MKKVYFESKLCTMARTTPMVLLREKDQNVEAERYQTLAYMGRLGHFCGRNCSKAAHVPGVNEQFILYGTKSGT